MSQAKKNLGCIPGRLKALRAAAEILNILTLSLIIHQWKRENEMN
jgi:hypothetical protein